MLLPAISDCIVVGLVKPVPFFIVSETRVKYCPAGSLSGVHYWRCPEQMLRYCMVGHLCSDSALFFSWKLVIRVGIHWVPVSSETWSLQLVSVHSIEPCHHLFIHSPCLPSIQKQALNTCSKSELYDPIQPVWWDWGEGGWPAETACTDFKHS